MTFSFYSSLKSIPREMHEAAQVYRLSWWQRFLQLELPYAAIGLIWNSMMSVAGGWFFLMACEMFVLGNRDLRLPGLGSYLQTAANAGDTRAIVWGLAVMIASDRADRPGGLAPGHRLGGEIQIRAGGGRRGAALTACWICCAARACCRWPPRTSVMPVREAWTCTSPERTRPRRTARAERLRRSGLARDRRRCRAGRSRLRGRRGC